MALLHRRGVRGYVTLNTLVFPHELAELEAAVREVTEAGVDAVIVQDLGLVRLIRAITPDLEIHASTQMSITSAEGVALARELGCSRVILARELALPEINRIREAIDFPVEVFVHGALCVAYSGQCLTSEALGGRSANRGECAQACRMPYEIISDGQLVDLENVQYLLSPQDLAAYDLIPRLIELGVTSLKIEGRLKTAEYVANITRHYRTAIDEAWAGRPVSFTPRDVQEMQLSFSRGFSHGFLDGTNHKVLVRGDYAKKRGILLGEVESIARSGVRLSAAAPIKPGDGVVFDGDESTGRAEQGGRVYEVISLRAHGLPASGARGTQFGSSATTPGQGETGPVELRFGRGDIDLLALEPGQRVWKTDDPELTRRLRRSFEGPPARKVELDIEVRAVTRRAACASPAGRRSAARRPPRRTCRWRRPRRARPTLTCFANSSAGSAARSTSFADWRRRSRGRRWSRRACSTSCAASWSLGWMTLPGYRSAPSRPIRPSAADGADSGRACSPDGFEYDESPRRSSWRFCAGEPNRSRRRSGWASPRSTPIIRTSSNTRRPSRRCAEVRVQAGSIWPRLASRSRARRASLPTWPDKGPTGCWCGMRGAFATARSTTFRSSWISRSMRPIRCRSSS